MAAPNGLERRVDATAAVGLASAMTRILNGRPVRIEFWDGSSVGPSGADTPALILRSPAALDRLLGAMPERSFGRAYTEGLVDVEPMEVFLSAFATVPHRQVLMAAPALLKSVLSLGGRPDLHPTAGAEIKLHGRRHSRARDAAAIAHHYDLPLEFYRLWLDSSLTYSCAYFETPDDTLESAQQAKLELVCRKLRLRAGEKVLDVGCGWGSFAIHAAQNYDVEVVAITLSRAQADAARERVHELGLEGRVSIRLADYRDPLGQRFDAVASIGMVEHVGRARMAEFARSLHRALRPGGRLLLHGITIPEGTGWSRGSFADTFVFPDGELEAISWRDARMQEAGFELRDTENLREHYAMTLERWVQGLRAHWDEAVELVGHERARVWLLYMTGAMVSFRLSTVAIFQSLFVRLGPDGTSGLPLRRSDIYLEAPPSPR